MGKTRAQILDPSLSQDQDEYPDDPDNNETVRELRENRYRQYQRKLMALKYDIQNATENSYSIIENNNNAFRSIKSPGSSSQFKMAEDV